jgi:diguanylate cyclase (GGDEF)-like protein/PAS domain S-box-containing protein
VIGRDAPGPDQSGDAEMWASLARLSSEFFTVIGTNGEIRSVSSAAQWVLGYDIDEYATLVAADLVHPDDLPGAVSAWREASVEPGSSSVVDCRLRHKVEGWRWFKVALHNLVDDPHVMGMACHLHDIDERHKAETELRNSERWLDALLENADGSTAVFDAGGEVTWFSVNGGRPLGLTNEEFIEGVRRDLVHPDDLPEVQHQFLKVAITPGASSRFEARMRHADGGYRWIECTFTNCLDDPAVSGIVANIRDMTERVMADRALRESERRLEHQATHDPLTGLPNRTLLIDCIDVGLASASVTGSGLAVLFIDLDQFKVVNDSQGHATGDRLLVSVASRLRSTVADAEMIARFGGDEFVILSTTHGDEASARALAEHVLAAFDTPFALQFGEPGEGAGEVYIDASIGVALSTTHVSTPEDLIRNADAAMYKAKARGRGRLEVFDDELRSTVVARHERQVGLRRAIDEQEFEVLYQQIVSTASLGTEMVGAEALVRWRHPTRGLLSPIEFIGEAEDTGLIVPIGRIVMGLACNAWSGLAVTDAFVSVNLSVRQLADPAVVSDVAGALATAGLSGERLHVEVTESALMADLDATVRTLGSLKDLGIQIAVDDFGTGYSSFSYLRRLPVDCLKIDKTFIDGLVADDADDGLGPDHALVGGMCQLGHSLGLSVVAEGVEVTEQLDALRDLGCDLAQGYLFARPVPAEELLA